MLRPGYLGIVKGLQPVRNTAATILRDFKAFIMVTCCTVQRSLHVLNGTDRILLFVVFIIFCRYVQDRSFIDILAAKS